MRYFLGIDGGGTKTEYIVGNENRLTLGKGRIDLPLNPVSIGMPESCKRIENIIYEAKLFIPEGKNFSGIYAGIAGGLTLKDDIEHCFYESFPNIKNIAIGSDAVNLLNLSNEENCVALISGTGCVCFLRNDGVLTRLGGWGYHFDKGSGFCIGREGLFSALSYRDGILPSGKALHISLSEVLGNKPENMIKELYSNRSLIASLARQVIELAERGDERSESIVSDAAKYSASLLISAFAKSGKDCLKVVFGGGITDNSEYYRKMINVMLPKELEIVYTSQKQAYGAFLEALKLFG